MTKNDLIIACQLCINSYEGVHGEVKKILDNISKYTTNENIEYYKGNIGNTGYIIFRGTDEFKDWAQNLETKSIDIGIGQMHLGFYEDDKRVEKDCFNFINRYEKIKIIGHSKGACQSLLLYYFAKRNYPNKDIQCIALAPAKCMSKQFKNVMQDVYTVINGEDYVCKIPFWKFTHMGKIIRIGKRNIFFWIPFIRMLGAWAYHHPLKYLAEIKKYKKAIV